MYNEYFGFSDSPFQNNLDQRFLFLSEDHKEALAALLYFLRERKGFALICGDVGTGKTMLINGFIGRLPSSVQLIMISNPCVDYVEILSAVARKLNMKKSSKGILELLDEVKEGLTEANSQGKRYVLIIDEAHLLSDQSLEHIRLLSNIETPTQKLLQILLVGQYELSPKLDRPEMRQLRQRISINRFLAPMNPRETIQYINHRLKVVGSSFERCFESGCAKSLQELTGGVPRRINQLCDNALLIVKTKQKKRIDRKILKEADTALRTDLVFTPVTRKGETESTLADRIRPVANAMRYAVILTILFIIGREGMLGARVEQVLSKAQSMVSNALHLQYAHTPPRSEPTRLRSGSGDRPAKSFTRQSNVAMVAAGPPERYDSVSKAPLIPAENRQAVSDGSSAAGSPIPNPDALLLKIDTVRARDLDQIEPISDVGDRLPSNVEETESKLALVARRESESQIAAVASPEPVPDVNNRESHIEARSEVLVPTSRASGEENCGTAVNSPQKGSSEANRETGDSNLEVSSRPPPGRKVVVKKGDTLTRIALRLYVDRVDEGVQAILLSNPIITNRDLIYPEQVLIAPKLDYTHQSF